MAWGGEGDTGKGGAAGHGVGSGMGGGQHSGPGGPGGYGGLGTGSAADIAALAGALADAIDAGQSTGGTVGTAAQEDVEGQLDPSAAPVGVSTNQNAVEAGYYGGPDDEANLSDAQEGLGTAQPNKGPGAVDGAHPDWGSHGTVETGYSMGPTVESPGTISGTDVATVVSPTVSPKKGYMTHEQMYPGHRELAKKSGVGGLFGLLSGKHANFIENNKAQMISMGITPSHTDDEGNLTGKYSGQDFREMMDALALGGTMATEESDYGGAATTGPTTGPNTGPPGLISQGQVEATSPNYDAVENAMRSSALTGLPNTGPPGLSPDYGTMATEEFDSPTPLAGTPYDANEFSPATTVEEANMGMAAPLGTGQSMSPSYDYDPNEFAGTPTEIDTSPTAVSPPNTPPPGYSPQEIGLPNTAPPGFVGSQEVETNIVGVPVAVSTEPKTIEEKAAKVVQEVKQSPQLYGTKEYEALAKERLGVLDALRANPQGTTHGINNNALANAYASLDSTMKAYAVVHGPSKFGTFAANIANAVVPGLNWGIKGLRAFENSLIAKGIFDKTSGKAILEEVADKMASGEPISGGGGPGQEEDLISKFISQYPWAEGLDPNYIKYLIANPQELQKLLTGETEI